MSEYEFNRSTLKKIFALAKIHSDVHNPNKKEETKAEEVYIDQIEF